MSHVDVSIIVPVYNVEDYICECLESVMNQIPDLAMECLIVNDCGTDDSIAIAERVIQDYHGDIRFQILHHDRNRGLSAARNTGILAAKGQYIYLLDSDDIITDDCLADLYKVARNYPEAQIITGDFQTFPKKDVHRSLSLVDKKFPEYSCDTKWIRKVLLSGFPVISCNKLYRRDWMLDNRLFFKEGIIHEDDHWVAQAYPCVTSLAFLNKVTYLYRQREGSITNRQDAQVRRIQNLSIIYAEMFGRQMHWDYPWAQWVFTSLNNFREKAMKLGLGNMYKELVSILLHNPCVPFPIKLGYLYFRYSPIVRGRFRLLQWITRHSF